MTWAGGGGVLARWWNPPTPRGVLEAATAIAPCAVAADVVHHWAWHRHGAVPAALAGVFGPAGRGPLPRLTTTGFHLLGAAVVGLALAAAASSLASALAARRRRGDDPGRAWWWDRMALAGASVAYWWWAAETARYGTPTHARTALVVTLVALATRERAAGPVTSGWPLRVAAVALAFLYASAGWEKLRVVGRGWWSGGATEAGIVLWGPAWAQRLALAHPGWVHAAALAALLLELAAPIPLLAVASWRRPAAALAGIFHLVVALVMGIDFLPMAVVCGLVAMPPAGRAMAAVRTAHGATCVGEDDGSGGPPWHARSNRPQPLAPRWRSPSAAEACSASATCSVSQRR